MTIREAPLFRQSLLSSRTSFSSSRRERARSVIDNVVPRRCGGLGTSLPIRQSAGLTWISWGNLGNLMLSLDHHLRRVGLELNGIFPAPFWHSSPSIPGRTLLGLLWGIWEARPVAGSRSTLSTRAWVEARPSAVVRRQLCWRCVAEARSVGGLRGTARLVSSVSAPDHNLSYNR